MAKLADAIDLGSIVTDVGVQVPLVAPDKNKTNLFGFVFLYKSTTYNEKKTKKKFQKRAYDKKHKANYNIRFFEIV